MTGHGPLELKARDFARRAHGLQMYGRDNTPYTYHLHAVAGVLWDAGIRDAQMLAAAWLHDVLEDTATSPEELLQEFGLDVAIRVWAVTNGPGRNRAERHKNTWRKIRGIPGATLLKLADRIANVAYSLENGSSMLKAYRREHGEFQDELLNGPAMSAAGGRRGCARATTEEERGLWLHLERLIGAAGRKEKGGERDE